MLKLTKIEELLAEDDWIRRLARRLVPDSNEADDLAQEAWLAALGPSGGIRGPIRPWLSGVLRNLARLKSRSEARRQRRELEAAREESLPSTSEVVEAVSLRQEVASVLLELDEPYRSTLYLHFFCDLSLKEIAKRTDTPTSTVHDRLHGGLQRMRVRLDRAHGGRRSAWAFSVLSLGRAPIPTTSALAGGILMSTSLKVIASTLIVGAAIGVWIRTQGTSTGKPLEAVVAPAETRDDTQDLEWPEVSELAEPGVANGDRTEVVAAKSSGDSSSSLAPSSPEEAPATVPLVGRVMDSSQLPVAGLEIGFRLGREPRPQVATMTDGNGRFSMDRLAPPDTKRTALFAKLAGGTLVIRDPMYTVLAVGLMGSDELIVLVESKANFSGRVVDDSGNPIEDARLTVRVRKSLYKEVGLTEFTSYIEGVNWSRVTDATGAFSIVGACGGGHVYLDTEHPAYLPAEVELHPQGSSDLLVALEKVEGSVDVTGRVVDTAGAPVSDAQVSMGNQIVRTNRDGLFRMPWSPGMEERFRNFWEGDEAQVPAMDERGRPLRIVALKPEYAPAWVDLVEPELTAPLELVLGPEPLSISGTVRDELGKPLEGIVVWVRDLTPFGKHVIRQGEQATRLGLTIEEQLRGGRGVRGTLSKSDGAFALGGLMPRSYSVGFYDPQTACYGPSQKLEAGSSGVDVVMPRCESVQRVAGRVVSATGQPIPGVVLHVQRSSSVGNLDPANGPPEALLRDQTTDDQGAFEFPALATEGTTIRLFGEQIFFRFVRLSTYDDLENLEIVEPVLCELQIDFEDDPEFADQLRAQDEDGNVLTIIVSYGALGNTMNQTVGIDQGRTGVLRVPETARTLVLLKDGFEITRRDIRLELGQRWVERL